MEQKIKKSDQTKAKLLQAMWELILEGDKVISVGQLPQRQKLPMDLFIVTIKIGSSSWGVDSTSSITINRVCSW